MKALVLVPVACALALAGCGDDDSTTTGGGGPLVTYARTGGFASMPESLIVETDGTATVEAGVDPAREQFELAPDELDRLTTELESADFDGFEQSDEPSACADCYVYDVTYGDQSISYDESQEVPESVSAVVAHLSQIAADHYPQEALDPPIVN